MIAAPVHVNTGSGSDTLAIDTSGNAADLFGSLFANRVVGLGTGGQISFALLESLDLTLGAGADTLMVQDTPNATVAIDTGRGADVISVRAVSGATTIAAGSGADLITISTAAGLLDGIAATLDVRGGIGPDELRLAASGDTTGLVGELSNTSLIGMGMSGQVDYAAFETLVLTLGSGDDELTITGTHVGTTTIDGQAGADTFQVRAVVGSTTVNAGDDVDTVNVYDTQERLGGIRATLTLNGEAGADVLNVRDSGATTDRQGTLTGTTITGLGMSGQIDYLDFGSLDLRLGAGDDSLTIDSTHTASTTIDTGEGADAIAIRSIAGETTVDAASGADTITVGDTDGRVQGIAAALTITGGVDADSLIINNTGDDTDRDAVLSDSQLTGLGMAGAINYDDVEALDLELGSGSDSVEVRSTHAGDTTINGAAAADEFTVRSVSGATTIDGAAGSDVFTITDDDSRLAGIGALLTVRGGGDTDSLILSDAGNAIGGVGELSSNRLSGFGMMGAIDYLGFETLDLALGLGADTLTAANTHLGLTTILAGAGADAVTVQAVAGLTTIDLGVDNDQLTVSDASSQLRGIAALLTIAGGAGSDRLDLDSTGEALGRVGTLTNTTITGLGMVGAIEYGGLEALQVELGSGDDIFTIESTHGRWTRLSTGAGADVVAVESIAGPTTIDLGEGTDLVTVSSPDALLTGIASTLSILGRGDIDSLVLDASGGLTPQTGALHSNRLTGLGAIGDIGYQMIESLEVRLGAAGDLFTIESTHASQTTLLGGDGDDTITFRSIAGPTTVDTGAGADAIVVSAVDQTIQSIQHSLTLIGGTGDDALQVDNSGDVVDREGQVDASTVVGFGMVGVIGYAGFETFALSLGTGTDAVALAGTHFGTTTIETGGGADSVHIQAVAGSTTLDLGVGDDSVLISSLLGTLDTVGGDVAILGGAGVDEITADLSSDLAGQTGELTATSILGLGMTGRIDYAAFEALVLTLGGGDDDLTVSGTHAGLTGIDAGAGDDVVTVSGITGQTGISGGDGIDTLVGAGIADDWTILDGGIGNVGNLGFTEFENLTIGGDEADNTFTFLGTASIDFVLDGGGGYDTIDFSGYATSVLVNLASNATTATGGIASIERIIGSALADTLIGDNQGGDWHLTGVNIGDIGGTGVFDFVSFEHLAGGSGGDTFIFGAAGVVTGTLDGGGGRDTVDYSALPTRIRVNLPQHLASRVGGGSLGAFTGVENVIATNFDDGLVGNDLDNELVGLGGDDTIFGGLGDDVLHDGHGNDLLDGGLGDDRYVILPGSDDLIIDSGGDDLLDFSTSSLGIHIDLRRDNGQVQRITANDDGLALMGVIENLTGSEHDDRLTGSRLANEIHGLGGDDRIDGLDGDDLIRGGDGADDIDGGADNDRLFGEAGDDLLRGKAGDDVLDGGAGDDELRGEAGDDRLEGGEGADLLIGGGGNDVLLGNAGHDELRGDAGADLLSGNEGDDLIAGGGGRDTLTFADAAAGVSVDLAAGTSDGHSEGADELRQIEDLIGSRFADQLTGDNGANEISGGLGDDLLSGGSGNDRLLGGEGADTLHGEAGKDELLGEQGDDLLFGGEGNDALSGGAGDDALSGEAGNERFLWSADDGDDLIDGGLGRDELLIVASEEADQITLAGLLDGASLSIADPGSQVTFRGVEQLGLDTQAGADQVIVGDLAASGLSDVAVELGAGDDVFDASAATTNLDAHAGAGDDQYLGGNGNVRFDGGEGEDHADYSAAAGAVKAKLGSGRVTSILTGIVDRLSGVEEFTGSSFADDITGSKRDDILHGGDGADLIRGKAGDDRLDGGAGDDVLSGDQGYDRLSGGDGADHLDGGKGRSFIDYADYTTAAQGVSIDLAAAMGTDGNGDTDTYERLSGVLGSRYDDLIVGDDESNQLFGGEGDDTIRGGDGNDVIEGGAGADVLQGEGGSDSFLSRYPSGDDEIFGGQGLDRLRYIGSNFQRDVLNIVGENGWLVVYRTNPTAARVASLGVEYLDIETGGGDDDVSVGSLLDTSLISLSLDLGDGNLINGGPGDTFTFTG